MADTESPSGQCVLAGRTIIVTGAGAEMGTCYVHAFATAGANVVATDHPRSHRAGIAATRRANGVGSGRAIFVPTDVTSDADWAAVVRCALSEFGRLDVLVNNATVTESPPVQRALTDLTIADWDGVLAANVRGTWQGIKAATGALSASGGGRVVNVSSVVGHIGPLGYAHYVASKAAVEGLTRAAASELRPLNICVNAVATATAHTTSDERPADPPPAPIDLVGALLWLASPSATGITGQTIAVDGPRRNSW